MASCLGEDFDACWNAKYFDDKKIISNAPSRQMMVKNSLFDVLGVDDLEPRIRSLIIMVDQKMEELRIAEVLAERKKKEDFMERLRENARMKRQIIEREKEIKNQIHEFNMKVDESNKKLQQFRKEKQELQEQKTKLKKKETRFNQAIAHLSEGTSIPIIGECTICTEIGNQVVLIPCGHTGLCRDCVLLFHKGSSCPFCRKELKSAYMIYSMIPK